MEHKKKMTVFIQMSKTQAYLIFCGRNRSNKVKWKLGKICTGLQPFTSQKRVSSILITYILC